ncbi:glycosyltransferase family 2 protein [Kocuria tytonicola]|uniref:4,4'-diaponeurosporenoate glycosyltransferase n=1 Tax=Kocuria tytonicola TaxID=2055946 RepID=A0A3L9KYC0_9MICC|nr:glycosyltransferase family A protein [Kocuria tytonicola]RLY91623.1 glycosyltransferase family 2 protein [Kocuria tytonicola]
MIRRVAVVVPACNEEERVGRCMASVAAAVAHLRAGSPVEPPSVDVVLAADSCTDRTVERAWAAWGASCLPEGAARLGVLSGQWRSAGGARAAAARHALAASPRPGWIASTDADTAVPPHWLSHQLERAAHGVDAVLGTVEPDPAECPEAVYRLWQSEHTLAEGHPHIHAANMGVRAQSYERAGGFPPLECSEDEALVAGLHHTGARVEATDRIRAITSARLEGRAELGFAHHLLSLAHLAGQPIPTPDAGVSAGAAERGRGPRHFAPRGNA